MCLAGKKEPGFACLALLQIARILLAHFGRFGGYPIFQGADISGQFTGHFIGNTQMFLEKKSRSGTRALILRGSK